LEFFRVAPVQPSWNLHILLQEQELLWEGFFAIKKFGTPADSIAEWFSSFVDFSTIFNHSFFC